MKSESETNESFVTIDKKDISPEVKQTAKEVPAATSQHQEEKNESIKKSQEHNFKSFSPTELVNELEMTIQQQESKTSNAQEEDYIKQISIMKEIRSRIDPTDEQYAIQKTFAYEGLIEDLLSLLESKHGDVVSEACDTLGLLSSNIQNINVRLRSGLEVGFSERCFNPVQQNIEDYDTIKKLVPFLDSKNVNIVESARQALINICSNNHGNQVKYLKALVHNLMVGKQERLYELDSLVSNMDIKDDAAIALDQAIFPILTILGEGSDDMKYQATLLVGNICQQRPAAAKFLCEEGVLKLIADVIITESKKNVIKTSSTINSFWQLIKHNKDFLFPEHMDLKFDTKQLIEPIKLVLKSGPLADLVFYDKHKSKEEDVGQDKHENEIVDYSDEALLLLKAFSERDPEFRKEAKGIDTPASMCTIS